MSKQVILYKEHLHTLVDDKIWRHMDQWLAEKTPESVSDIWVKGASGRGAWQCINDILSVPHPIFDLQIIGDALVSDNGWETLDGYTWHRRPEIAFVSEKSSRQFYQEAEACKNLYEAHLQTHDGLHAHCNDCSQLIGDWKHASDRAWHNGHLPITRHIKAACDHLIAHPWPPRCMNDFCAPARHQECVKWEEMKARLQPENLLKTINELETFLGKELQKK